MNDTSLTDGYMNLLKEDMVKPGLIAVNSFSKEQVISETLDNRIPVMNILKSKNEINIDQLLKVSSN